MAAEEADPDSTLSMYRRALAVRADLVTGEGQAAESLEWDDGLSQGDVLAFRRPGGWLCLTNFGSEAVALPAGELLVASEHLSADEDGQQLLPGATTVWLRQG